MGSRVEALVDEDHSWCLHTAAFGYVITSVCLFSVDSVGVLFVSLADRCSGIAEGGDVLGLRFAEPSRCVLLSITRIREYLEVWATTTCLRWSSFSAAAATPRVDVEKTLRVAAALVHQGELSQVTSRCLFAEALRQGFWEEEGGEEGREEASRSENVNDLGRDRVISMRGRVLGGYRERRWRIDLSRVLAVRVLADQKHVLSLRHGACTGSSAPRSGVGQRPPLFFSRPQLDLTWAPCCNSFAP